MVNCTFYPNDNMSIAKFCRKYKKFRDGDEKRKKLFEFLRKVCIIYPGSEGLRNDLRGVSI